MVCILGSEGVLKMQKSIPSPLEANYVIKSTAIVPPLSPPPALKTKQKSLFSFVRCLCVRDAFVLQFFLSLSFSLPSSPSAPRGIFFVVSLFCNHFFCRLLCLSHRSHISKFFFF